MRAPLAFARAAPVRITDLITGGKRRCSETRSGALHRPDGDGFYYARPVAMLVRVGDLFSTPVCAEHIEAGQAAVRGRTEVQPLEEWLAGDRGYRPGLAGT